MDSKEAPAAAAEMPGEVKGERLPWRLVTRVPGICGNHLDPPDFVVDQARTAPQWGPGFLCPPLAAFIPAKRFRAD